MSAGPALRGQAPVYCETAPLAGALVYGCSYPDQSFAAWRSPGPPWILLASILPGGTAAFTAEGNALWGLQPLPSVGSQLPGLDASARGLEAVSVIQASITSYNAVIARRNGEVWLIEYGVGCLGIWRYEGRTVYVRSPGLFAGVGSEIILPDGSGTCRIWDSRFVR